MLIFISITCSHGAYVRIRGVRVLARIACFS